LIRNKTKEKSEIKHQAKAYPDQINTFIILRRMSDKTNE